MKGPAATGSSLTESDENGVVEKAINSELWHACAGPLVQLPPVGSLVVYFPQGHTEQVEESIQKVIDAHAPRYPNLPSKLICFLQDVKLHADRESDEVYAQMMLQPVNSYDEKALIASELALKPNKPQIESFCKTLTASDTSTHGGFSVPRRAAEKIFPPLDFSMQTPSQELQARDLHHNVWTFRHIYRGQPKRHLLTSGWSFFVSGKKLLAGDAVIFFRDDKQQLFLGIRRADWQPTNLSSSVLSSDSMHIGILAAAAHAAANNSPFTVFYNPRASPAEFVVPLAKYNKATYTYQISLGMRFRMMLETEESGTRRFIGTITGINDLDPVRWKNSQWRNLQVGWDESAPGKRHNRISAWEIEPVAAPFFIWPPYFRAKRSRQPGVPDEESSESEKLFSSIMPRFGEENCMKESTSQNSIMPGLSFAQAMNVQQTPLMSISAMQPDSLCSLAGLNVKNLSANDLSGLLALQTQLFQQNNMQPNASSLPQQKEQVNALSNSQIPINQSYFALWLKQNIDNFSMQKRQQIINQTVSLNETSIPLQQHLLTQKNHMHAQVMGHRQISQQQLFLDDQHSILTKNMNLNFQQLQQQLLQQENQLMFNQNQYQHQQPTNQQQQQILQNYNLSHATNNADKLLQLSKHQLQLHLPHKLQQQPSLLTQKMQQHSPLSQIQELHQVPFEASYYSQLCTKAASEDMRMPQPLELLHQKLHQQQVPISEISEGVLPTLVSSLSSTTGNSFSVRGTPSVLIDDIPSCSKSVCTNNSEALSHYNMVYEKTAPSALTCPNLIKEFPKSKHYVKSSVPICISHGSGVETEAYDNNTALMEYLDSSSTANSICVSKNNRSLQQSFPLSSFNQLSTFEDSRVENMVQGFDSRNNILFGVDVDGTLGISQTTDPFLAIRIDSATTVSKDAQQELSLSMVSQPFGFPDMIFNSIDSTLMDSDMLNRNSWGAASQLQCKRTYTKVYKRGAVGRSIDLTRYSGYDELKCDLAQMFSIDRGLEDWQRIGWKLVYVDHENDVLLVGDDPWEEFVNCVRYIKILSPQEVQQMSLDGGL